MLAARMQRRSASVLADADIALRLAQGHRARPHRVSVNRHCGQWSTSTCLCRMRRGVTRWRGRGGGISAGRPTAVRWPRRPQASLLSAQPTVPSDQPGTALPAARPAGQAADGGGSGVVLATHATLDVANGRPDVMSCSRRRICSICAHTRCSSTGKPDLRLIHLYDVDRLLARTRRASTGVLLVHAAVRLRWTYAVERGR